MRIRLMLALAICGTLQAAELELKPETLKAWDEHVKQVMTALQQRLHGTKPSLRSALSKDRVDRIRNGEIVVWPAEENCPKHVASGLIHDWIAAGFIPDSHVEDVLGVLRSYSRYKELYKPSVIDAKLLKQTGGDDHFSLLLRNMSFFSKTALDTEYDSSTVQVDDKRWYSVSCSTRVQEIENFGQPGEHKLPPDEGHGYIWRGCSVSQFEERDGGVYVDEEMLALSREVPTALRWVAGPIIRRVAKETLALSLTRTRTAVTERVTNITSRKPGGAETSVTCSRVSTAGCLR